MIALRCCKIRGFTIVRVPTVWRETKERNCFEFYSSLFYLRIFSVRINVPISKYFFSARLIIKIKLIKTYYSKCVCKQALLLCKLDSF